MLSNPAKLREYLNGERLDEDDFVINDIPLKIPPVQIKINKESFNFSFDSLRTPLSTIVKSGRSIARISIDITFQGEDSINDSLIPMVAGLRATPFCAIVNKYLSQQLHTLLEEDTTDAQTLNKLGNLDFTEDIRAYKLLQPVVLALTNMTFSTMGHENMVDCIAATLDFIWFNYKPYTPIWAYKTGDTFAVPGPAWDSKPWQAFYAPMIPSYQYSVTFDNDSKDYPTIFRFKELKEFYTIDNNMPGISASAQDLVNFFSAQQSNAIYIFQRFLQENSDYSTKNVYDKFYQQLLKERIIRPPADTQQAENYTTQITSFTKDLLDPLIKDYITNAIPSKEDIEHEKNANKIGGMRNYFYGKEDTDKSQKKHLARLKAQKDFAAGINSAALEMKKRISKIQESDETYKRIQNEADGNYEDLGYEVTYASGKKPEDFKTSTLKLFGRWRRLTLSADRDAIVTRISVSFRNNLSIIPMIGYRYPTCQYLGSSNPIVEFEINASNDAASKIQKVYDLLDYTSLKFKSVPQGFLNLAIENNFLKLFNLFEFQTESIESVTIPNQPGRSMVLLQLVQSNITSQSTVNDSEELTQEYIVSNDALRQEIFNILNQYIVEDRTQLNNKVNAGITNYNGWLVRINGIVAGDSRSTLLFSLIERAKNIYNEFINTSYAKIYNINATPTSQKRISGMEASEYSTNLPVSVYTKNGYIAVNTLLELTNDQYGYIPKLIDIQKYIFDANKKFQSHNIDVPETNSNLKDYSRNINKKNVLDNYNINNSIIVPNYKEINIEKKIALQNIGFVKYQQSMRELLDEISQKYLYLDDFKKAKELKFKAGLGKGNQAYPDFKEQIKSVAALDMQRYTETNVKDNQILPNIDTGELLQYDPDAYMWYPVFDGSLSAISLIDENIVNQAKQISIRSNQVAQNAVDSFFSQSYLPVLSNEVTDEKIRTEKKFSPYKQLIQNINENIEIEKRNKKRKDSAKQLSSPYYENATYCNSTQSTKMDDKDNPDKKGIDHKMVPDPNKAFTNWYPEFGQNIICEWELGHTTDFNQLWNGIGVTPSGQSNNQEVQTTAPIKSGGRKENIALAMRFTGIAAKKYNIEEALILATIDHESSFSPNQKSPNKKEDSVTKQKIITSYDQGFMQINNVSYKNEIAKLPKDIFDPETNIMFGTSLLAARLNKWQKKLGSEQGMYAAIASYNVGDGGVNKLIAQGADLSKGPYVSRTLGFLSYWRNYLKQAGLKRIEPNSAEQKYIEDKRKDNPAKDVQGTVSSPILEAIKEFEISAIKGEVQSILRAYPTFKLYFIEDDSGERKRLAFDDFFSYSAVKSIRIIQDKDIAANLCVLELINTSGVLSNRKFRQKPRPDKPRDKNGNLVKETMDPMKTNTSKENPIASLLLQEGTHIHLKLGNSNDPDKLDPVFTGKITEIEFLEGDNLIQIVAQDYGTELVTDIKGLEEPKELETKWWSFWGIADYATTGKILEEMISQPEVLHFGRWEPGKSINNINTENLNRDLLTDKWQFKPRPAEDNIFAPHPDYELDEFGTGFFFADLKYIIKGITIWDIFQEMTLRHPNYIASTAMYKDYNGERMTMFFGLPNQLYFARHPNPEEQQLQDELKQQTENILNTENKQNLKQVIKGTLVGAIPTLLATKSLPAALIAGAIGASIAKGQRSEQTTVLLNKIKQQRLELAKKAGWIRAFRKYHIATSQHHIIANNIETNSQNIATNVTVKYPITEWSAWKGFKSSLTSGGKDTAYVTEEKEFTMKLDAALPSNSMNTVQYEFANVNNKDLAKRYAVAMLNKNIKNAYKGDITLIGNPRLKPYDILFLFDDASDMTGPIEIKRVIHIFTQESGFITEVTPQMLTAAAEWTLLNTCESMCIIAENMLRKVYMGGMRPNTMSPLGWFLGNGVALFGGSMAWKLINYTSSAQPIVMSPLIHHGRIFAGGIPTSKLPVSIWYTMFGDWFPGYDEGYENWCDDIYDKFINTLKDVSFQNTRGEFFRGWKNRSFDVE